MKRNLPLLSLLLACLSLLAFRNFVAADPAFLAELKQKLQAYQERLPEEKIYVHLDKTFFKPGEDIWFQVYAVDGSDHTPSRVSDIVYVELVNPKGTVEAQLPLLIRNGRAKGDFQLPGSAPGGLYLVRAYTRWMKNFGEETFFRKKIQVQKVIAPRILLKLDFEKKAYGASDEVVASLEVKNLNNEPVAGQPFSFQVQLNGAALPDGSGKTDKQGKARLTFTLPPSLSSPDGLLNVVIRYDNRTESISRAVPIVLNQIALQFFPEGGELVQGLQGKVAFKALNEFGKPADVAGEVLDDQGRVVQTFQSFHQGMGAFSLLPQNQRTYRARITRPMGIEKLYPLPAALARGYSLAADSVQGNTLPLSFHAPAAGEVYLVAQVHGKIHFSTAIKARQGSNKVAIPLSDFPMGIAQVTLFNPERRPVCERLVFVNPHKKLYISITADKSQYKPREKVALAIKTTDADGRPVAAALSLSVADDKIISFADDKQDNLLSQLLLSSELKGQIEEPSFYFKENEPKASRALDYLLLTQGWRRFTWNQVLAASSVNLSYQPEKVTTYEGRVLDPATKKAVVAKVTLLELTNRKRVAQLKTRPDGTFSFKEVDASGPVQLLAYPLAAKKQAIQIVLTGQAASLVRRPAPVQVRNEVGAAPEVIVETVTMADAAGPVPADREQVLPADYTGSTADLTLSEDRKALEEVVVVGYGTVLKSSLTGAVATVYADQGLGLPNTSVGQMLQGRVSGVVVTPAGDPGASAGIRIRGINSLPSSQPLIVVDGVVLGNVNLANSSVLNFLSPNNIQSIEILKSPEDMALYGSGAAHGVILITTLGNYYPHQVNKEKRPFTATLLPARSFAATREFYVPAFASSDTLGERTDFRSTIYWNPEIQTNEKGEAQVSFYNSDEVTAFRATAEGLDASGLAGRQEMVYATQLPFSLDAKVPAYFTFGDEVQVPVFLKNNTPAPLSGRLEVTLPANLAGSRQPDTVLSIQPGENKVVYVSCTVKNVAGPGNIRVKFSGAGHQDAFTQPIEVLPKGFPVVASFSGRDLDKAFTFHINDPLPGSVRGDFTAYPDIIGDLMAGLASILQEPHGCFEQVSSSTYPNILALQYLKETNQANPEIEQKALQYIKSGYKQLAAYETKEDGFEWYGGTPPHEGLTAFGLMEFLEMQPLYSGVDPAMIKRTKNWLLSRRAGDGSFKQNRGRYGFSAASGRVNNAYLVYALSEAGVPGIAPEFSYAGAEAWKSKDAYRLALLANAAFNLKDQDKGGQYLGELLKQVRLKGPDQLKAEHSIVLSFGKSLQVETAALTALAILKSPEPASGELHTLMQYLISSRSHGGFGSTQATVLALKALTAFTRFSRKTSQSGTLALYRNGQLLQEKDYTQGHKGAISFAATGSASLAGLQQYRVRFTQTQEALPYSVNLSWTSLTPNSSRECALDVETSLSKQSMRVGETVRLQTKLTNKKPTGQPMSIALVGIPAGLSPQPWQLKELQEKGVVDYYEVKGNYVVFYYRELGPKAVHQVNLDLKAEVPGTYQASASSAYLYYTAEHKDWEAGEQVVVLK